MEFYVLVGAGILLHTPMRVEAAQRRLPLLEQSGNKLRRIRTKDSRRDKGRTVYQRKRGRLIDRSECARRARHDAENVFETITISIQKI